MPAAPDPAESNSAASVSCDEAPAEPPELVEVVPDELAEAPFPEEALCPEPPVAAAPSADTESGLDPLEQAIVDSVAAPTITRKRNFGPCAGSAQPLVVPM